MQPVQDLAQKWLALDQDESTRQEIQDLVDANDVERLESRLRQRIAFGTAGLRASMNAGFAHMNSVIVIQTSQGLAQYVLDQKQKSEDLNKNPVIVVGFDARHNSEKFARLASAAFLAKGCSVLWFSRPTHTPMVPFAINHYGAAAGIMITASHNPKEDNGYKVYWSNGCQIIPPHDAEIASAIKREVSILHWSTLEMDDNPLVISSFEETFAAYFNSIQTLIPSQFPTREPLDMMYTPMHGVGLPFMQTLAKMLRLDNHVKIVASQAAPDPDFPTVPFPNPEEKGALDRAKAEAERLNCPFILANDPDADRFAAAERLQNGKWHQFTGNQMGVLLASYLLGSYSGTRKTLAMLASTVSSRMLSTIATREGFRFQDTLTGFKWMGNEAQQLQESGYAAIYAYEESLGYMFPAVVWDKDGIAAAAVFIVACMEWREQGLTPWQKLQQLYQAYGYFEDSNTYLITPSSTVTNRVFNDIRSLHNGSRPQTVGRREILRWRDLTLGYDSETSDNKPYLPVDANAQMITCELHDVVFTARGSGTEPKLKLYIEAKGSTSSEAQATADEVLSDLLSEWFKAEYGLRLAGT